MLSRRSFVSLLSLLPFVKLSKAEARELPIQETWDRNKPLIRERMLGEFLQERERVFGFLDEAAWPGWTKEERKHRLDTSEAPSEARARWALWNAWYEKGNTEPLNKVVYVGRDHEQLRPFWAFVEKRTDILGPGNYGPLWPGWTLEERLSQVMIREERLAHGELLEDTRERLVQERDRWLEPYRYAGLVMSVTWDPRFLELPNRK